MILDTRAQKDFQDFEEGDGDFDDEMGEDGDFDEDQE